MDRKKIEELVDALVEAAGEACWQNDQGWNKQTIKEANRDLAVARQKLEDELFGVMIVPTKDQKDIQVTAANDIERDQLAAEVERLRGVVDAMRQVAPYMTMPASGMTALMGWNAVEKALANLDAADKLNG